MSKLIDTNIHELPAIRSRVVIGLMASKWAIPILEVLSGGVKRYSEIDRSILGIKQKPLTATLRTLERNGLIQRIVYPIVPPKVEYSLTDLGNELLAIVAALDEWSEIHCCEIEQAQIDYDARDVRPTWMVPRESGGAAND